MCPCLCEYPMCINDRPLPHVTTAQDDMGEHRKLQLLRDGDGDIIVSVLPVNHRFTEMAAEFCVPGHGGGRSHHTFNAMLALMQAMELDTLKREQPQDREEIKKLTHALAYRYEFMALDLKDDSNAG